MIWIIVTIALIGVFFGSLIPFVGLLSGVLVSDLSRAKLGARHQLMFWGIILGCLAEFSLIAWIFFQ